MKTKIIIQDEFYNLQTCKENPQNLYVFGDNIQRIGKGGQAIIRDLDNAVGIATKKAPGMAPNDFFNDNDSFDIIEEDIINLHQKFLGDQYNAIIFPRGGLGTGLSQMPEHAPKLFEEMVAMLKSFFNIDLTEYGFTNV